MPRGLKFEVRLDVARLDRKIAILRRLGLEDEEILDIVGRVLAVSARNRITDTNVGPNGVPWPPSRRVVKGGGKTLYDKHNLGNSITHEVRSPAVLIGVDGRSESAKNAAALQFGSNRQTVVVTHMRTIESAFGVPLAVPRTVRVRPHARTTNLPARPFLGVSVDDKADIRDALKVYLRSKYDD